MAKKKWYVVTKGTAVGVFGTWLEVVPLVSGVSGARHQSFPTKEEAIQAFSDELIKGRVKVVDVGSSASSNGSSPASWAAAPLPPRRSQSHGSVPISPLSGGRPVRRSTSELAYIGDRYNGSIRRGSGDQEQVSLRMSSCMSPAATVRTPSSLGQYPSEHSINTSLVSAASSSGGDSLLSPIQLIDAPNSEGAPSRGSQSSSGSYVAVPAPVCDDCVTKIQCIHCSQTIEESSDDPLSNSFSQIHVTYTLHDQGMDPRSPMAMQGHLPASTSSISFGRPSPEPSGYGGSGSLLFRQ